MSEENPLKLFQKVNPHSFLSLCRKNNINSHENESLYAKRAQTIDFLTITSKQVYKKLKTLKMDELEGQKIIILGKLGVGFGNLTATAGNLPPATEEAKPPDAAELLIKAASNCCGGLLDRFCCMCFLQSCSYMSDRCAVAYTQLCTALACLECLNCCYELCA